MRKYSNLNIMADYKIIGLDDELGILDSLDIYMKKSGYDFVGVTNPVEAIEKIKKEHFDILILDFLMSPFNGDEVVRQIREFNTEIYIILLTGHKDLVPPLETIKELDIQGYCEKSSNFNQLLLLIESGVKYVDHIRLIKDMNKDLMITNERLEKSYIESIQALRKTVEAKDPYTKGHSDRVSKLSVLIGQELNLSKQELEILKVGGLFHDIGKIGIPDCVLQKPGRLSDDEYSTIKQHSTIGSNILKDSNLFREITPIIKYHHEKYDGSGYPEHLKGDNIPYLARITSIADTYDAMSSRRPYRNELELQTVKDEIKRCAGTQFDARIANAFLNILDNKFDKVLDIYDKIPIK